MRSIAKSWSVVLWFMLQGSVQAQDANVSSSAFDSGFQQGANVIRQDADSIAEHLDVVYSFVELAEKGVLPPILRAQYGPQDIDGVIKSKSPISIIEPARSICQENYAESCVPLSWRRFLYDGLPEKREIYGLTSAIKSSVDFQRGQAAAQKTFSVNLIKLRLAYEGMMLYKGLESYGLLSPPAFNAK